MTFDDVTRLALSLPDVEEGTSYRTPAFKLKGRLLARYRPELDSLAVRIAFKARDELMASDPDTYYITDHYLKHPWVLVLLSRADPQALKTLLQNARGS